MARHALGEQLSRSIAKRFIVPIMVRHAYRQLHLFKKILFSFTACFEPLFSFSFKVF